MEKICNRCGILLTEENWEITKKNGREYLRSSCRPCKNKFDYTRCREIPERYERKKETNRLARHNPDKRARFSLTDSQSYDTIRSLDNDLNLTFVTKLLSNGCFYCGSTHRVGLDRKDNSLGHIQSNVVPACIRCNFIRRGMPYEAWILLVPTIRIIYDRNLLGEWSGGFNHHNKR